VRNPEVGLVSILYNKTGSFQDEYNLELKKNIVFFQLEIRVKNDISELLSKKISYLYSMKAIET